MSEPTRCYAVTCGVYSDYRILAIYRRREDAEARVQANNSAAAWLVDGQPFYGEDLPQVERPTWDGRSTYMSLDTSRAQRNPAREEQYDLRVEELDYYEGEALPAPLKEEST
jgi:hypothetical protein